MADPEVLIIGAGPTGLVMAVWLARLGVPFRIIEKNGGPGQTSRAMAVHARTLEYYRQLGFADEVVQAGIKVEKIRLFEGGRKVAELPFGDFGKGLSPYPFVLTYPQDEHERLLGEKLRARGVAIEWNTTLVEFKDTGDYIEASLRKDGREDLVQANFICGCDGVHSVVRDGMKLKFPGGTYRQMFFVSDVAVQEGGLIGEADFYLAANQLCLAFPIRSSGMVRLIGMVPPELADRKEVTFDDIYAYIKPMLEMRVEKVNWFSTYHTHHRVADRFRAGRAFVAGDAGHIHSPAGGQGMNTGIGDATNLSWKLAATVKGKADPSILDTFEIERMAFARSLVSTTDRLFQTIAQKNIAGEIVRTMLLPHVLPFLLGFSPVRRAQFRLVSQTRISYRQSPLSEGSTGDIDGGDRLPWIESGSDGGNFEPLKSLDWQIHIYGNASSELRRCATERGLAMHEFQWSEAARQAGFERDSLYLVRPDGHVAVTSMNQDVEKLRGYLSRFKIAPLSA
jgi:2-polyprenyl-6-methoxyphenol hydroxylase-like FAD-dependent oxidoreductase